MRFLLKSAFWLGGVFLIMPGLTSKDQPAPARNNTQPSAHISQSTKNSGDGHDLISQWQKAGKTLQEISTFCERNPVLCASGAMAARQLQQQGGMLPNDPAAQAYELIRKTAISINAAGSDPADSKANDTKITYRNGTSATVTGPKKSLVPILIPIPAKRPD